MRVTALSGNQLLDLAEDVVGRGGELAFRARGYSMAPIISDGDQVVLGPLGPGHPRIGDVVLVRTTSGPRLHRLIRIESGPEDRAFVTRGDAPGSLPERIPGQGICGRVVRVMRPWRRWLSLRFVFRMLFGNTP